MIIRECFPTAANGVISVVRGAADTDLNAPTPCRNFNVRALVNHFIGTTGALATVGRREPMDAVDPYGAQRDPSRGDWQQELVSHIGDLAAVWSRPAAWTGSVDMGGEMPATMIGEMAMAEILLHGWDLARATGQRLTVPEDLAGDIRRSIEQTAELGRSMGAYGPEVTLTEATNDFDHALAASGRNPSSNSSRVTIGA